MPHTLSYIMLLHSSGSPLHGYTLFGEAGVKASGEVSPDATSASVTASVEPSSEECSNAASVADRTGRKQSAVHSTARQIRAEQSRAWPASGWMRSGQFRSGAAWHCALPPAASIRRQSVGQHRAVSFIVLLLRLGLPS